MPKKKRTPGQKAGDWTEKIIKQAGYRCEVCHQPETRYLPLHVHFIDRHPKNRAKKNLAVFCTGCGRNFAVANPEGLSTSAGLWTFALNRDLYKGMIKPVSGVDPSPAGGSKRKSSSPRSTATVGR